MESQVRSIQNDSTFYQGALATTLITPQTYKNTKNLIFLAFCLCLSPFYYGFTLTYISTINKYILNTYFGPQASKPAMIGILIGIVPIGAGVGALLAPIFMNFMSRKKFLLFFNAVALLIAGVIQINNLPVLLGCRFVQGFIVGNYMGVVPIYIKQITPTPLRGTIGAMSQFINIGGVVVCYFFGLVFEIAQVDQQFFWRFMFSFTAITVLIQSILLLFNVIPQSPISLIEAGQLKHARKVLSLFNSEQVLDKVFSQYIHLSRRNKFVIRYRKKQSKQTKVSQVQMSARPKKQGLILTIKDQAQPNLQINQNILITPSFIKAQSLKSDDYSIQIQTIMSRTQSQKQNRTGQHEHQHEHEHEKIKISLHAFIIGFQLPLMQQFSGVKMIVTEIGVIIYQYNRSLALYSPLIINIVQLVATAFSFVTLDKFGRRPILLFGNLGVALCSLAVGLFFLAIHYSGNQKLVFGALAFILVFMVIYGVTIGPAVWLYVPEIIPPKIVPPATFMNWFGVSVSVIFTPIVIEQVGSPFPVFFFFGGISLIFFILNYSMVIETKGLEPSKIAQKLS